MLCTGLAQQYPFNKCELSFLKGTQASICYRARSFKTFSNPMGYIFLIS